MKARTESQPDFISLARHLDIRLIKYLGPRAWLGLTQTGLEVVLKEGPGAGPDVHDFLIKCNSLYPSFSYPQIILADPGFYLLYKFIPGHPLSSTEFEAEENLAAVFDLSGRVSALCRSLKLAPMFQGLYSNPGTGDNLREASAQRLATLESGLDYRMDGLAVRRSEASQSYAWAQGVMHYCSGKWPENDPPVPWETLRERVETVTSIHLTVQGSNLAHTCFTPDHILIAGRKQWGLVGWQVAPRPYNYMRYRYLAWCLIHTVRGEIETRYRKFLKLMPTIHASAANLLTFVVSLLETWVDTKEEIVLRDEKSQAILNFMAEALSVAEQGKAV